MMYLLTLLACQSGGECRTGFTLDTDGMCYAAAAEDTGGDTADVPEAEAPTVEDVLDALPACEPTATDGRLDIEGGCADGACAGMTYAEMVEEVGEEPYCEAQYFEFGGYASSSVSCDWSVGMGANFDDVDRDGAADDGATSYSLYVSQAFDGGTTDGLGVGANLSCFRAVMGDPDSVGFELVEKDWLVTSAYWGDWGVSLYDHSGPRGSYDADGRIDALYLYGSTVEL